MIHRDEHGRFKGLAVADPEEQPPLTAQAKPVLLVLEALKTDMWVQPRGGEGYPLAGNMVPEDSFVKLKQDGYPRSYGSTLVILYEPKDESFRNAALYNHMIKYEVVPPPVAAELEAKLTAFKNTSISLLGIDRGYNQALSTGSDPELFVVDEHGVVIPAFSFLRDEATVKAEANKQGLVRGSCELPYWDGFQAEWNIVPGTCHAYAMDSMAYGISHLYKAAIKHNPKAKLSFATVVELTPEQLAAVTKAQGALGCAPSFNIYENVSPLDGLDSALLNLRFAGCHIHIGTGKISKEEVRARVAAKDRILGPIMTSMLGGLEDTRRRQFYGRAGEYRLPVHGVEYRVPSSAVLCHPIVAHIVFDFARFASYLGKLEHAGRWLMPGEEAQAQHILNNLDVDEARANLKLNARMLREMLSITYTPQSKNLEKAFNIITEGAIAHMPVDSIEANWHIKYWSQHSANLNCSVASMQESLRPKKLKV